jgi:hypothetical protein
MAYINGLDFIEFVKGASRDELDRLARHVLRIIEQNVEQSRPQKIAHATLAEKVKSVAAKCSAPVLEWFAALPTNDLLLPVGACHGDLTLSNVLFCHNGIALIDFLDNFVETPLQDMVKIRQDTCFFWSCQLYRQPYDPVRTALALKYLDRKFEQLFSRYGFYTEHYRIFQFINLARILPYCETSDLQLYVEKCIKDLLNPQLNPLG